MKTTTRPSGSIAWRTLAALAMAGVMTACGGGGGGGGGNAGTPPTIANLAYTPQGAYLGAAGGTATITGTVDFSDPDGDIESWTLTVLDASGRTLQSTRQPVPGAAGVKTGTLSASAAVSTAERGDFTFRIELSDQRGLRSAAATGSFRVTTPPWATRTGWPLARPGFATASMNGRVYVMGGSDPAATVVPPPPIDRVDVYDPATDTWSVGTPMAVPMSNFVARVVGGRIVAVGAGGLNLNVQVQEFDPVTAAWTLRRTPPSGGRLQPGGAVAGGRLYTLGGERGGFDQATVESFDPGADLWRSAAPLPAARRRLTAVTIDIAGAPRILALGGYSSTQVADAGYFRAAEAYDPASDTWAVLAAMPTPVARAAAAVFDGRVFTFGGDNVERGIDTVQRYDPGTNTWAFRAALPAPATGLQAEVAGRDILVFTGSAVWVYTPDNDLW